MVKTKYKWTTAGKNVGREDLLLTLMYLLFILYLFSAVKENSVIYVFGISDDLCSLRRFSFMRKSIH